MSIRDEIKARCDEGRLFRHFPRMAGGPERRQIYLSVGINDLLSGHWDDAATIVRWAYVGQDLDRFIEEEHIPVAADPRDAGNAYISQLEPPEEEVWEIRSRAPKQGIRVFGRFAEKDAFVALVWAYRLELRGFGSEEFEEAKQRCIRTWNLLFVWSNPITGSYPHDYITGAVLNADP